MEIPGISYFSSENYVLSQLNQREPRGVLNFIQDKKGYDDKKYMVQFDGQNLNFKFGLAVNSDWGRAPNIVLPYLYCTYGGLLDKEHNVGPYLVSMGVVMQCLLYDSNGNVISA